MAFFDFLRRRKGPIPSDTGAVDGGAIGMGSDDAYLTEPGEGGPSVLMSDLAGLRWAAQQEALNVGRSPIEPELWEGGRLEFEYERVLAHEHEGLRDRLADFVGASSRDVLQSLYAKAGNVATTRDSLEAKDRELAVVLDSWNRTYREVHEDELELGRYMRMRARSSNLFKGLVAVLLFGAEFAVSAALFGEIVEDDNPAYPVLFSLGLVLVLVVVPHYAAIGLKDGVTRYHEAERKGYQTNNVPAPVKLLKKARLEEVEDRGIRWAAGLVGLVLLGLIVPVSVLRGRELGDADDQVFWFAFFLLLQMAISGYFFLREWHDYGTAATNLKREDETKAEKQYERDSALEKYADAVSEFMTEAQDLYFLMRQAPRWDSHIVETYLGTLHYFRHIVTLNHPDLDVFIANATVPYLGSRADVDGSGTREIASIRDEHRSLERSDAFGRDWWIEQINAALVEIDLDRDTAETRFGVDVSVGDSLGKQHVGVKGPADLLDEFLRRFFGLSAPYVRPDQFDLVEEVHDDDVLAPLLHRHETDDHHDAGSPATSPRVTRMGGAPRDDATRT